MSKGGKRTKPPTRVYQVDITETSVRRITVRATSMKALREKWANRDDEILELLDGAEEIDGGYLDEIDIIDMNPPKRGAA